MLIVTDYDTFNQALQFINGSDLLAYDVETTGLNPRKDKIIGFGVSNGMDGFYVPLWRWEAGARELVPTDTLAGSLHFQLLEALKTKRLLMFNASFDARFTKYNFGINLLPALDTDVLLLKHTCDEEHPFGLKEIATKLWGTDVKAEKEAMQASIKANGGTAKEYYKADTKLIAAYCVQDCLLTMRVYNYYAPILRREGLTEFYYSNEVLPLYKQVTIPMEERGVALDIPKLQQAFIDIVSDITDLELQILQDLTPLLGAWTQTYLDKEYPLATAKGNATKLAKEMAKWGWTDKWRTQFGAWRKDNPSAHSPFNLNSKHHLKALFFDILGEKPLSKTPTGQPQVDDEFLSHMASKFAWCTKLTDYNKLVKIKGTYIDRFLEEQEDGIFYPSFYQHRTVSGRYGSDLQQLPRPVVGDGAVAKYTNLVREFIIARPGHKLVSADYEQLEPSIFAHTSGDTNLQNIFRTGKDFYSEVAIRTEQLKNVSSDKSAANYLGKLAPQLRQRAKAYALGIAYGMTGYKMQFELNIEREQAEKLVRDYLNAFPELERWMNDSKDKAKFDGHIRSQLGRVRRMPQAVTIFRKYGQRIFDSLQLWKDYNETPGFYAQAKEDRKMIVNLCNNAINFQVQSVAASIVNRAAISIANKLQHGGLAFQVHDQLVYEVLDSKVPAAVDLIQTIMQNNIKLSVPLKAQPIVGSNFRECK